MKRGKRAFMKMKKEFCTKENHVFTTQVWINNHYVKCWANDDWSIVFISHIYQKFNIYEENIGLLTNKKAINDLYKAYNDNDYYIGGSEFAETMIPAVRRAFSYVDEYVDEDGKWHAGGWK
jgi:hypothetical protein